MNFDEIINRKGTYCTQWDYIEDRFGKGSKDITPFSISDTDFKVPDEIISVLTKRISHGIFGYSRWNHNEYRGAIKNWYDKRYKTNIENDWVIYSPAVLYSITLILELLLKRGEKVMTHTPRYDGFTKLLSLYEVVDIKLTEKEDGIFETDFNKIEEGFKAGAKVFLLCNPENPTGKIWKQEELETLIKLCQKYNVTLISDDIHMDIARKEVTPILKISKDNCIIVSSASKTFNTPALGGSYAIIPDDNLRNKFLFHIKDIDAVAAPNILGMLATMTAYNECGYWVDELNKYLTKNCEYVVSELNNYKGLKVCIPEATYLVWISFEDTKINLADLKKALVEVGRVGIMSGENYGDPTRLRFNVGGPLSKVKIGVEGIKKAIDSLIV